MKNSLFKKLLPKLFISVCNSDWWKNYLKKKLKTKNLLTKVVKYIKISQYMLKIATQIRILNQTNYKKSLVIANLEPHLKSLPSRWRC
jgi:hypothetical protein